MTSYARVPMSQCHWGSGSSHTMDIVLQCSIASMVNALVRLANYKVFVCSSNPFTICVHTYKEAYLCLHEKWYVGKFISVLDSSVRIAVGYRLDAQDSIPGKVRRFFFYSTAPRPILWSTQPPIKWVSGSLSTWIKQLGLDADPSPPLMPRSRMMELCLHYPIWLHGVVLN
jgi:hypothetical protein